MAGYFDYLGRVFAEKGSWYKILMIVALQAITIIFSPKAMFQQVAGGVMPQFNIPGIILYFLASTLIFGFVIQIYNSFMNNREKLLPDVDFLDMFVKSVRVVPFGLVWGIYFAFAGVFGAMVLPTIATQSRFAALLVAVVLMLLFFCLVFSFAALMIIHTKSFSYKYVLNPVTAFRIFPRVVGPMLLLILLYGLLAIVLFGLLFGGAILLGVTTDEKSVSAMIALGMLFIVFGYLNNAFSFAYNLKFADIVKTRLADTEYLDDEYGFSALDDNDENNENDEMLDY